MGDAYPTEIGWVMRTRYFAGITPSPLDLMINAHNSQWWSASRGQHRKRNEG